MSTTPIPPILDQDRYAVYQPTAATTDFALGFPLFGEAADVAVYLDGNLLALTTDYTVRSVANGTSLTPAPVSDAYVRLTTAISSGKLEIFGNFRPRRTIQASAPYGTRDFNFAFSLLMAAMREMWSKFTRSLKVPVGEEDLTIPSSGERAGQVLAFDGTGKPTVGGRYADLLSSAAAASLAASNALDSAAAAAASATAAALFDPAKYYLKAAFKSDGTPDAPVAYDGTGALNVTGTMRLRGLSAQQQRLEWWAWNGTAYVIDWILYRDTDGSLALYQQANGTAWRVDHSTNKVNFSAIPSISGNYNVAYVNTENKLPAYDGSLLTGLQYLQSARVSFNVPITLTAAIPWDNTKPQITEGTQVLTVTLTPKSANSLFRVRFESPSVACGGAGRGVAALFINGGADAVALGTSYNVNTGNGPVVFSYVHTPGNTNPQTFTVRMGPAIATSIVVNSADGSISFGGTIITTMMTIEEVAA